MMYHFKNLMVNGIKVIRKELEELLTLIKIMSHGQFSSNKASMDIMPCFKNQATLESEIRNRLSGKFNT